MSIENLKKDLVAKRAEVTTLRAQLKARSLQQTHLCKQARREVARILTQINKAQ